MTIQLDTEPAGPDGLDLASANDEAHLARAAVKHWEAELAHRVADLQALDRWWMVALTQLTGSRDQRLEAATASVRQAQVSLEVARRKLEEALHGHAEAARRVDRKLATEAERIAELETVAVAVREGGGPEAEALMALELRIDGLRGTLEPLLAACGAASGVVAAANTVARRASSAKHNARAEAFGVPLAGLREWVDILGLRREHDEYVQRVQRLESTLQAVGGSFDAGGLDGKPSWLEELMMEQAGNGFEWLHANRYQAQQESFETIAHDARQLADHLGGEHRVLKERLVAAEDEREALLVRRAGT